MTSEEIIAKKCPKWPMVLLRLFMAYYLIFIGVMNWQATLENREFLQEKLKTLQKVEQFPWFQTYLDAAVNRISDSDFFVWLMIGGPLLLGAMLGLGLLSRLSALAAILMVLHLALIEYHSADTVQLLFYEMQLVVLLVIFFSAAGRKFGLDGIFWRHRLQRKYDAGGKEGARKSEAPDVTEPQPIPLAKGPVKKRRPRVEETEGFFTTPVRPQPAPRPAAPKPVEKKPAPAPAPEPAPEPKPVEPPKETPIEPIPLSDKRMTDDEDDIVVSDIDEEKSEKPETGTST